MPTIREYAELDPLADDFDPIRAPERAARRAARMLVAFADSYAVDDMPIDADETPSALVDAVADLLHLALCVGSTGTAVRDEAYRHYGAELDERLAAVQASL